MVVNNEQLIAALVKFIDTEIVPKANFWSKAMIVFVAPSLPSYVNNKIAELKQMGIISDLFDENGNIKLEELRNRCKVTIQKCGKVPIPMIGYFADEEDVERIYQIAKSV